MTAINHAVTGAAIGIIVGNPFVALPVAFLSHFVCDAIPHFRVAIEGDAFMQQPWFKSYLIAEFVLCLSLVAVLAAFHPLNWQLAAICAFVAAAPDLLSIKRFNKSINKEHWEPTLYGKFATNIQWFERPIGALVEAAWFIAGVFIIMAFL